MEEDVDVTDIESDEGVVTVFTPNTEYGKARLALVEAFENLDLDVDEIQFIPQSLTTLEGEEDITHFRQLVDLLEDLDDVQRVYHNVDLA